MEDKKIKKERFEAVQIPIQHAQAIRDNENQTILQDTEILTEILNKLNNIERAVAW